MAHETGMTVETVDRQRKYVAEQQKKGAGLGVVFGAMPGGFTNEKE